MTFAKTRDDLPALDGMRGVAAVAVVVFHMAYAFRIMPHFAQTGLFSRAYLAVDFFFQLSGFVIAYAYEGRLASGMSPATYVRARFVRLYPLLVVGMALGAAALIGVGEQPGRVFTLLVKGVVLIPTLAKGQYAYPLNLPTWSLFFELVFNVALLALFRASNRTLCLICLFSGVLMGIAALMKGGFNLGGGYPGFPVGFPRTAMSICGGVLLYRFRGRIALARAHVSPGILLATLFVILALPGVNGLTWLLDLLTVAVAFPVLIAIAAQPARPRPVQTFLGDTSYPLYLVHAPALTVVAKLQLGEVVPEYLLAPGLLSFLLLVSFALLKTYDEPVRRLLGGRGRRLPPYPSRSAVQ